MKQRETVLYRAAPSGVLQGYVLPILISVSVLLLAPAVWLLYGAIADGLGPVVVGVLAAAILVVLALAFLAVRALFQAFIVTAAGIKIRTTLRTVTIPWSAVSSIEVDQGFVSRGRTIVVTTDGRRVGSAVTDARYAMRRGESTYDHGPDLLGPALPTRAARDAHSRYLSGEFSTSG